METIPVYLKSEKLAVTFVRKLFYLNKIKEGDCISR